MAAHTPPCICWLQRADYACAASAHVVRLCACVQVVSQDNSKGCDSQAGQQSPACSATAQDTSNSFYGKRVVFYNVAENKTEPELLQLFSQHGVVADMFIVRSGLGTSSGCGYVTFATDEQASAALRALQGSTDCAEYGTSLGVLLIQEGMPPPGSNSASRTSSGASSAAAAAAAAASDDAGSTTSLSPKAAAQLEQTKSGKAVSRAQHMRGSQQLEK